MSSESTSPDDHDHVDVTVSPPQPSPPGDVSSQEIGGSTNASGSTTTATTPSPLQQEAPRNGTTASTIRAINDDDPPIPVWQVADHEKETNGPQLHDGPPGPPRFPQELDDSLAKKVEKERAAFPAPEDRLRHEDIGSGERTAQETGGGTKVGDMTAAPMVQEEVIQGGMLESMIHAISDDDPPIPVLQVANHEKSEGNQAERVANEFEHDSSDHPRDNAPTVHSTMGASDANAAEADPPMVGTNTSTNTKSPGAAGSEATNSGTKANAGIVTIILPQATMVTPGDDDDPEPTIVASIVLPFYRRKGFLYVMVAMILLAVGIAVAVPLSSNVLSSNLAPQPWTYQAKLLATDGEARDYFGWSVSIYRDTVVVGAPCENYRIGSVHVFVRSEKEWTHQAKLLAPDGAVDDYFGFSRRNLRGEEWTHQAKLLAPGGAVCDYFGDSVAIYGDTIIVGADWDDDNGDNSGSAHVFVL
ncbi:hypothetical protein THAOC_19945 [Thalassiosira oceanica]|uniref:Uncharacterized protein n=1 Tax=Thalassiosira oceanica TaxID=159749 RepID=K0S181_THAOC|nr:hypothetical protein THAOC_19945 [Thalassiosira oceanica]|eukprot:EJK59793.1 hypothetical protein THAOC_19945 [Thalassiosira oceanica]